MDIHGLSGKALPKRAYVEAFRIVYHAKLYYTELVGESNPAYDDCPTFCGTQEERRETYCEGCPAKRQQDTFQRILEERLTEELGDEWKEWSIMNLLSATSAVRKYEAMDSSNRTASTQVLIDVLEEEREKKKRIELFELQQQEALISTQ